MHDAVLPRCRYQSGGQTVSLRENRPRALAFNQRPGDIEHANHRVILAALEFWVADFVADRIGVGIP
jgi:hypothetical protein